MAQIIWTDPARDDLAEIYEYSVLDNPEAAERIVNRILRHVNQLEKHPKSGSIPPELPRLEYRQSVEPPCRIFYKVEKDTIFIVHVMHFERLLRPSLEDRD